MICQGCGASYESSFKFCPHCGEPRSEPDELRVMFEEGKYEICEVEIRNEGGCYNALQSLFGAPMRANLEAVAVGEHGKYIAGVVTGVMNWPDPNLGKAQGEQKLDMLIESLVADGWEPLPRGEHWYSYRFRRKL